VVDKVTQTERHTANLLVVAVALAQLGKTEPFL
jgi:hypothetical protein